MIANPYLEALKSIPLEESGYVRYPQYKSFFLGHGPDFKDFRDNRDKLVKEFSWAIPSDAALKAIVSFAPRICEIGAGTGYWAWMLTQYGAKIVAYDIQVPKGEDNKWGHDKTFFPVKYGDVLNITGHQDRALMLCWPPYSNTMSSAVLRLYSGNKVIYIGEGEYGCTGCDEFHDLLHKDFVPVEEIDIPQWDGLHDSLYLYKRK